MDLERAKILLTTNAIRRLRGKPAYIPVLRNERQKEILEYAITKNKYDIANRLYKYREKYHADAFSKKMDEILSYVSLDGAVYDLSAAGPDSKLYIMAHGSPGGKTIDSKISESQEMLNIYERNDIELYPNLPQNQHKIYMPELASLLVKQLKIPSDVTIDLSSCNSGTICHIKLPQKSIEWTSDKILNFIYQKYNHRFFPWSTAGQLEGALRFEQPDRKEGSVIGAVGSTTSAVDISTYKYTLDFIGNIEKVRAHRSAVFSLSQDDEDHEGKKDDEQETFRRSKFRVSATHPLPKQYIAPLSQVVL